MRATQTSSMRIMWLAGFLAIAGSSTAKEQSAVVISTGWLMQDVAHVTQSGEVISKVGYSPRIYKIKPYVPPPTAGANLPAAAKVPDEVRFYNGPRVQGVVVWPVDPQTNRPSHSSKWAQAPGPSSPDWYRATVPGTVLTTLVNNNIYPEPTYGENNRPNTIPESLCRTSYWYRTEFNVPADYAGRQIWLNFEGVNYIADVWVNGKKVGTIKGAFIRGIFNVTALIKPGKKAALAVRIAPPPHPGDPWEKTIANERGPNGGGVDGPLGQDGPTFVASIGWDWVAGRSRSADRHLAESNPLGYRSGAPPGSLRHNRPATAAHRFGRGFDRGDRQQRLKRAPDGQCVGQVGRNRFPLFVRHARAQLFPDSQTESSKYAAVACGESEALVA